MRPFSRRLSDLFFGSYHLLWLSSKGMAHWEIRLPGLVWIIVWLGLAGLIWLAFAFTPLKYTLPGYPTRAFRQKYIQLLERVEQLEQRVQQHLLLVEELRRLQPIARREPPFQGLPLVPTLQSGEYMLPIEGQISRRFHAGQEHWGVDITCNAGEPVLAMAEGTVIFAEYSYQSGYVIALQHPNGLVSFYKHNSRLMRRLGEKVRQGEVLALSGGLGAYSSGPHLHIETWMGGKAIDPLKLLAYE
ncbi:MAG: M23 family metallopeptidase [Bacteroidia bacterium]|nr:M23 family metallopeptidase [Bacteroidia bacterium]MDW8088500.1 M23 family metallopeptidase [Bacteroidia bacterium]